MGFWTSLSGQLQVELTSAEPEDAILAAVELGMEVKNVEMVDSLTCRFLLARRDYAALEALCARRGDSLRKLRHVGLYWPLVLLRKRPVLVAGMAFLIAATMLLPRRVLFFRVEGNERVSTRRILEAAGEAGLSFGTLRRQIRSEKIKNDLLASLPELQWAGVNTSGMVATISVREKPEEEPLRPREFGGLVAARDGYILSTTVIRGTALCQPGQVVQRGQLLVSPYADYGQHLGATGAEGVILAQTNHTLSVVTPSESLQIAPSGPVKRKISLTLGKKRINLWKDSGILDGSCGRMVASYDLTLPGGFRLPVTLWVENYTPRISTLAQAPDAEKALSDFAKPYVQSQLLSGEILSARETVADGEGVVRLTGHYICTERIDRLLPEQIGDTHGKND